MNFTDYLFSKGFSSTTVKGYTSDIERFNKWLKKGNIELEGVLYADVLHYIQSNRGKLKNHSSSVRINSIKHYFDYLISLGMFTDNPASSIVLKGGKRKTLYNILSKQELEAIYHNFELKEDEKNKNQNWYKLKSLTHLRNKTIIGLIVYQGLNSTDLSRLRLKDLKLREGKVFISSSRRSNQRELTLESVQILDLMEYVMKTRDKILQSQRKESEKLIVSTGTGDQINNALFSLMKKLRIQNNNITSYKQIRTSVITHWLKQYNLRETQYRAGHRYIGSTEAYLINDLEDLSEDILKFHPLV